ncbi:MAG TPA: hypothetical protein VLC49_08730 [Solirubrobacteraceae bacterium]|nr:hypothetical protein [Solirubrobacteraceae bacterium]
MTVDQRYRASTQLSEEELNALREFWQVCEPRHDELVADIAAATTHSTGPMRATSTSSSRRAGAGLLDDFLELRRIDRAADTIRPQEVDVHGLLTLLATRVRTGECHELEELYRLFTLPVAHGS